MAWIIFDTETSDLFNMKLPADDEAQGRLAQLGVILVGDDLEIEDQWEMYVRPDGWSMQPGATGVNGLTDEILMARGVPIAEVLDRWNGLIDEGRDFAAYHAQFDGKVMRGELRRAGRPDRFEDMRNSCMMRSCQKLGVQKEGGGRGWPKLSDACRHFGIVNEGEHTAGGDSMAAYHVFRKLVEADALIPPAIHYAKNRPEKE